MQQFAIIGLPGGTATALALKIAIAFGPARRFVVGNPAVQRLDTPGWGDREPHSGQ
jgi:hypothetical protein